VLLIAGGVQVPVLWMLGRLVTYPGLLVAAAALLTVGFVACMRASFRGQATYVHVYLGMWPFFVWWTVALLFALLAPLALLAAGLVPPLSIDAALGGALALAAVATVPALRSSPRLSRHDIPVDGLPAAFDGYRVVQISDLHCGPFVSGARVARWVASVNALEADLVAVTGDLIVSGERYVPVVAEALGRLQARDGVLASMGNHDYFTDGEALVRALERAGLGVLRNRGVIIERGEARANLFVAGVDDTWTRRHDLDRALAERPAGAPTLLLCHDPALFPAAVARGVDLTLSGHTHGGQLGVPGLGRRLNLYRLFSAFTSGLYRQGASTLYVNRGLGTTGPPVRLGVPSEIAVLTLRCRARGAGAPVSAPEADSTAAAEAAG
jgi:predicted MPP superfamily phosphohydrolase